MNPETTKQLGTRRRTTTGHDRPYARYAFLNPYNLVLFAGAIAFGLLSGHGWVVVVAAGAEVLWLILAPDSKILQRLWFDRAFEAAKKLEDIDRRKERIGQLTRADSERLGHLYGHKQVI